MRMIFILIGLLFSSVGFAESGILILAHGSMSGHGGGHGGGHDGGHGMCGIHHPSQWEKAVLETVDRARPEISVATELAFGMWNTRCFDEGVSRLERRLEKLGKSLDHLIVFPLFISSHSSVIEMQKFIFKKREEKVIPIPSVQRINFSGKISYLPAIDYDPQVSLILEKRLLDLIADAEEKGYERSQMDVILTMHGPVSDTDNTHWLKMGEKYISDLASLFPLAQKHVQSLRDDAPEPVREAATQEFRDRVIKANQERRIALILPLLVSRGGIDSGVLERLDGLNYIWRGEMLLPDTNLEDLLVQRLKEFQ